MLAAGEGDAFFDHQFPLPCRQFPVDIPRPVAGRVGTDIADFAVVVSLSCTFRKLRRAGPGFRKGGLQRIFTLRQYEKAFFNAAADADPENAQQIRKDIFFTGKSNPSKIGYGDGHRETFGAAGWNRQQKLLLCPGLEKGVADEESPCAVQGTEEAAVRHGDDDADRLSRPDSLMGGCNRSLYGIRKPPCRIEGAGYKQGENDSREQEEVSPQGEKEQEIDGVKQQECGQM